MKVLVSGASGFIGGNLARQLVKQGYEVRALIRKDSNLRYLQDMGIEFCPGDLLDPESLKAACSGCDAVFHAAAMYTFWSRDPSQIYRTNIEGTRNILNASRQMKVRKVVYTSSESAIGIDRLCLYGNENMQAYLRQIPGDYKKSKFMAENLVAEMYREGLPVVIVNPTTPIGPYDIKPTPTGQIVTDYLNHRMFACVDTGLNVVDVEDVARGHILALEKGTPGERYLLGNENMTLREMMLILEAITGIKAPRWTLPHWLALSMGYVDELGEGRLLRRHPRIPLAAVKASAHFRHFDCSKAIEELGLPQTPIQQSFEEAVKWFRDNGYVKRA